MSPLPISLCMIVRDAAADLPECLARVRGWFAQTVVVDTGSEDGTEAMAREAGAEVYTFPWCDDFAAARNAALDYVRQPWTLVLDADERLEPSAYAALEAGLAAGPEAFLVEYRNYTNQTQTDGWIPNDDSPPAMAAWAGWVPGAAVRLFRNGRGFRFAGRVHETLDESLRATRASIGRAAFVIHHVHEWHGWEYIAKKQRRYRTLLLREIAESGGTVARHTNVGIIEREFCDRPDAALAAFEAAIACDPEAPVPRRELAATLLRVGRAPEAQRAAEALLARHPQDVAGWYAWGLAARQQGDLAGAERALGCVTALRPEHLPAAAVLAELLLQQRRAAEARPILERLRRRYPANQGLLRNLSAAYAMLGLGAEARAVLDDAVRATPGDPALWNNLGVMRAQAGDTLGATAAFRRVLELHPGHPDAQRNLATLQAAG